MEVHAFVRTCIPVSGYECKVEACSYPYQPNKGVSGSQHVLFTIKMSKMESFWGHCKSIAGVHLDYKQQLLFRSPCLTACLHQFICTCLLHSSVSDPPDCRRKY